MKIKSVTVIGLGAVVVLATWGLALPPEKALASGNAYSNPYGTPAGTASYSYPAYGYAAVFDPGVRGGVPAAGGPLATINSAQSVFFNDAKVKFQDVEGVADGLGPRFNANSCASCHAHPAVGGSSPLINPQLQIATADGGNNAIPWFITRNGPVREARFKRNPDGTTDGNVHAIYTITGRSDAVGCRLAQFSFLPAGDPLTGLGGNSNIIFRIPTPLFGAGLIEAIPDSVILANQNSQASFKAQMGIRGRPNSILSGNINRSANDGTITRFGWKAQNKSLLLFSAEAYNVEMGITNEVFTDERDQTPGCVLHGTPEDTTRVTTNIRTDVISDVTAFANFMRLLAPPTPAPDTPAIVRGRATFNNVGCAACHTPVLTTAPLVSAVSAALPNQKVNLYSDLLLHNMGTYLADGITQGAAGPDEFRTAPLWGLGQRVFFLHDGRSSNLLDVITAHRSSGSEASAVVNRYYSLSTTEQQEMLYFLRSL